MATEHLHRYTPKQLAVLPINGMSRLRPTVIIFQVGTAVEIRNELL